jgi:hypothetical protein
MHTEAVTPAGAALIRFARSCGLIPGEWIAIDGSKFRAVASIDMVRERTARQRYLDGVEKADAEQESQIDQSAVQATLEKLKQNAEREAGFMLVRQQALPAYNIQTALDSEHALIVAHAVVLDASDIRPRTRPHLSKMVARQIAELLQVRVLRLGLRQDG